MDFKNKKEDLQQSFWEQNYKNNTIGWDIGYVSPPIKDYVNQLCNKELSILIPGAGNGYEAEYLFKNGFKNITVLDLAHQPLQNIRKRAPNFPEEQLVQEDFFEHSNTYDLIIEQTFFCALHPSLRKKYVAKMYQLLKEKGKLVGLLFDFELTAQGPPYGGSLNSYLALFKEKFSIKILERCYSSIKPRDGRELFFIFEKNN